MGIEDNKANIQHTYIHRVDIGDPRRVGQIIGMITDIVTPHMITPLEHSFRLITSFNHSKIETLELPPITPIDMPIGRRIYATDLHIITIRAIQDPPIAWIFPDVWTNIQKVQCEDRHQRGEEGPKQKEKELSR